MRIINLNAEVGSRTQAWRVILVIAGLSLLAATTNAFAQGRQYCSDRQYFQQRAIEEQSWNLVERAAREYIGYCEDHGGRRGIVSAHRALLLAQIAQRKYEEAIPIANRCTRLDPDDAICHAMKADALLRTGRLRLAKESAERAIAIGGYDENSVRGIQVAKRLLPEIEQAIIAQQRSKSKTDSSPLPDSTPISRFGTAWFTESGYAVTAYHVVEGASDILLLGADRMSFRASVAVADAKNDLAVLKVEMASHRPRVLRISQRPATLGGTAFTMGFPHPDVMGVQPKYTSGDISATSGAQDDPRYLQISAPVQAGNSGGPLIGGSGDVIGIVVSKLSAARMLGATGDVTENVGYALKAGYLSVLIAGLPPQAVQVLPLTAKSRDELVSQVRDAVYLVVGK